MITYEKLGGVPMDNALDFVIVGISNSSCIITFTFRQIHFRKVWIPLAIWLIVALLFFYKDGFGIK